MVHKASEMPREIRKRMRDGEGSVEMCHLEKADMPPNGRLFAKLTIGPGSSIGTHVHEGEAELFLLCQR